MAVEKLEKEKNIVYLSSLCQKHNQIDMNLYSEYDVKRGLRDLDGKGVLAGLTTISTIYPEKSWRGSPSRLVGNYVIEESISMNWLQDSLKKIGLVLKRLHIYYFWRAAKVI